MNILKAFQAAPTPAPLQQTQQAVRMLFSGHEDLIKGFEEWLPEPAEQPEITLEPIAFESRVYTLEKKVHGLQQSKKSFGINGGGASHHTDSVRIFQLEQEMANLKATVEVLGIENMALRDRVRQLDSYQAGPRWVMKQLVNKVATSKEENEMMDL